jgi:hypothetical protein
MRIINFMGRTVHVVSYFGISSVVMGCDKTIVEKPFGDLVSSAWGSSLIIVDELIDTYCYFKLIRCLYFHSIMHLTSREKSKR